ncbi:MAG: hypothetical protein KBT36_07775 [Kurthia sp.]|nr:hypothetical protein [Candidatus Kurthia equi]
MKKKYYFILLALILVTASLYIIMGRGGTNPQVIVDAYEKEWGISVEAPSVETPIYASPKTTDNTGQWATLYSYEDEPTMKNSGMEKITDTTIKAYEERIAKFEQQTLVGKTAAEQKESKAAFEEYPISLSAGDYGYYKEKNDGKDYFLAIYQQKKLYTYILHE